MKTAWTLCAALFLTLITRVDSGQLEHPQKGSAIRKAVCDEMRKYLRYSGYVDQNTGHFLFVVSNLAVSGDYCVFEGYPVNPDGSFSDQLPDIGYTTFLKRSGKRWQVIADLSRTDVPSNEEMRQIRKSFPAEIPTAIIPEFWRGRLRG